MVQALVERAAKRSQKVSWPTFKTVVNNTVLVLAMVAVLGGLIVLVDFALKAVVSDY